LGALTRVTSEYWPPHNVFYERTLGARRTRELATAF
jgi:hypothetical protein